MGCPAAEPEEVSASCIAPDVEQAIVRCCVSLTVFSALVLCENSPNAVDLHTTSSRWMSVIERHVPRVFTWSLPSCFPRHDPPNTHRRVLGGP
jgi:hypothetical protein